MLPKKLTPAERSYLYSVVNRNNTTYNNDNDMLGWMKLLGSVFSTVANVVNTKRTNAANERMTAAQNAMQVAENEKAYERSKATNQVNLLQQAGMSKAGALSTINGGGSYQPAPINVSQAQAPEIDLSSAFDGLIQIGENAKQRKAAEDLQTAQIKAAEDAQRKQIESDERKHAAQLQTQKEIAQLQADTTNRNADNRLQFDKEQFEFNKPKVLAEINQIKQNIKVLKTVEKGNNLDNIRKEFENKRLPELAKLANAQGWQQVQYIAQKMAHENADAMNKQERDTLELEFYRATMDSNINLQNLQNELQTYLSSQELNMYKSPVGGFIGALCFCMDRLVPKFAILK